MSLKTRCSGSLLPVKQTFRNFWQVLFFDLWIITGVVAVVAVVVVVGGGGGGGGGEGDGGVVQVGLSMVWCYLDKLSQKQRCWLLVSWSETYRQSMVLMCLFETMTAFGGICSAQVCLVHWLIVKVTFSMLIHVTSFGRNPALPKATLCKTINHKQEDLNMWTKNRKTDMKNCDDSVINLHELSRSEWYACTRFVWCAPVKQRPRYVISSPAE